MSVITLKSLGILIAGSIIVSSLVSVDKARADGADRDDSLTIEISDKPTNKKKTKRVPTGTENTVKVLSTAGKIRTVPYAVAGSVIGDFACTAVWCVFDKLLGVDMTYEPGDMTRQALGGKVRRSSRRKASVDQGGKTKRVSTTVKRSKTRATKIASRQPGIGTSMGSVAIESP